jgi:hypothetical protein
MSEAAPPCFLSHCSALRDPRQATKVLYLLAERGGVIETERRDYLCSTELDAETFAQVVRSHWGIENRLHWVLDVVFHDDLARLRSGHGPASMAVIKHTAMNLLTQAKPITSLKNRRKTAGWNQDYLEKIIRRTA